MVSAVRAPSTLPAAPARPARRARITGAGVAITLCALMLGASAFPSVRPKIAGLLVHPVTVVAALLFAVGLTHLRRLPRAIGLSLFFFVGTFMLSSLIGPAGGVSFAVKTAASAVTVVVAVLYVRNEADLRAAIVAFALAVALISVRGLYILGAVGVTGINPMEGIANKNGFSLFALPALLLAAMTALRASTPTLQRWLLAGSAVFIVFAVFSTGNRSGWLGVILIGALVGVRAVRRIRTLVLLLVIAGAASAVVTVYGDKLVIQDRMAKTNAEAPQLRVKLALSAMRVGLDNPVLGASPQNLPREMARLGGVRGFATDSHNVTGMLLGGTGFLGFFSFLTFGWVLARRPPGFKRWATQDQRDAHYLLRGMLVLWVVRGQFTAEILYSPSFSLAVGLCIAGCVVSGLWARRTAPPRARSTAPRRADPPPAPTPLRAR